MIEGLHDRLHAERDDMWWRDTVAEAIACMLKTDRCNAFTCFLGDERTCLTKNAAERALCGVALELEATAFRRLRAGLRLRRLRVFSDRQSEA